jgi:hypothetical protein
VRRPHLIIVAMSNVLILGSSLPLPLVPFRIPALTCQLHLESIPPFEGLHFCLVLSTTGIFTIITVGLTLIYLTFTLHSAVRSTQQCHCQLHHHARSDAYGTIFCLLPLFLSSDRAATGRTHFGGSREGYQYSCQPETAIVGEMPRSSSVSSIRYYYFHDDGQSGGSKYGSGMYPRDPSEGSCQGRGKGPHTLNVRLTALV